MKKILVSIFYLLLINTCFSQDLNLGLVAYYKLDGNATDAGPNGINGTITNVTGTNNSAGLSNKAMSFSNAINASNPAATSYITLPASPFLQLTGDKSFSFWIKPASDVPSDGYNEAFYGYGACGDLLDYTVYNSGTITASNGCGGNSYSSANGFFSGSWQHIVITESLGGLMKIYKNGIFINSGPNQSSNIAYGNVPYIGRYSFPGLGSLAFRGDLDQFRIYNRVLTQSEITLLSNENTSPSITSFTPDNGYTGTTITITGTNFTGATDVTIDGTPVASFTVVDANTITAVIGGNLSGGISVTTPGGTVISSSIFTYNGYITKQGGQWNDPATWLGNSIPPTGATVTINHNSVRVDFPLTNTGEITVNAGQGIICSSGVTNNGTIVVNGIFQVDAGSTISGNAFTYGSDSRLQYTSSSVTPTATEFPSSNGPANFYIITATLNLPFTRTISKELRLTASKLILGANDITCETLAGGPSGYVVTNGSGKIIAPASALFGTWFPVGSSVSSFDPVKIKPTNANIPFALNVKETISAGDFSGTIADFSKVAPRQWNITPTGDPGTTDLELTNGGSSYTPTTAVVGHYTGSAWEEIAANYTFNTWSALGITNFSPFGAGSAGGFATATSDAPVVNSPLCPGISVTVSGTSDEADGTVINLYINSILDGTTTVSGGNWSIANRTVTAGDIVKATAQATGENVSGFSNEVTVQTAPAAPTGDASQNYTTACNTIALLTTHVTGSDIKWYNQAAGGTLYNSGDPLVDGTTYYASQTTSGCESQLRLAVTAHLTTNYTILTGGDWTNAAIWSPCYPGTTIPAGYTVVNNISESNLKIPVGVSVTINGTVGIETGVVDDNTNCFITNNGTLNIGSTGRLYAFQLFNYSAATISAGGSFIARQGGIFNDINATLTNQGTIDLNLSSFNSNGIVNNTGHITNTLNVFYNINNNGTFNNNDGGVIDRLSSLVNQATFNNNTGATFETVPHETYPVQIEGPGVFVNNGTFKGTGIFTSTNASPAFANTGIVSPGSSPGCYTFSNGFNNTGGSLIIEINGKTTACTDYDRLTVTGTATLAGTLNLTIGYTPADGDQ
ncbi:MAG: LamG-like jellyroll fold domain-containing protein [Chitinophagaceae bacterium]